MPIKVIKHYSR